MATDRKRLSHSIFLFEKLAKLPTTFRLDLLPKNDSTSFADSNILQAGDRFHVRPDKIGPACITEEGMSLAVLYRRQQVPADLIVVVVIATAAKQLIMEMLPEPRVALDSHSIFSREVALRQLGFNEEIVNGHVDFGSVILSPIQSDLGLNSEHWTY